MLSIRYKNAEGVNVCPVLCSYARRSKAMVRCVTHVFGGPDNHPTHLRAFEPAGSMRPDIARTALGAALSLPQPPFSSALRPRAALLGFFAKPERADDGARREQEDGPE